MIEARVVYHYEDGSWWADSEDAPGYYAGASNLEELRQLVREGLKFHFEEPVRVTDEVFEVVSTTHPREDVEIKQTLCHRTAALITLGSTQVTTSVSRVIKRVPASTVGHMQQPSAC